jgi:LuxR family quorum sensing-dependent transcriptional regulator
MQLAMGLFADAESFRSMANGGQILDHVESRFRSCGATRFLATGLPLPGRPLTPLILRSGWGDRSNPVMPDDPVLLTALRARSGFEWPRHYEALRPDSAFVADSPADHRLIVIPVATFPPYQGCILLAGPELQFGEWGMVAASSFCEAAFARLFDIGFLRRERPGDLSARERRVIELSAVGKTASEIAALLAISQRTVHAHLQNASDKLRALNKTHTVVEALRYGQIAI